MKIEQLNELKKDVETSVKKLLGDKLKKVILYGSFARGDYHNESDIDFAAVADIDITEINKFHSDFVNAELDLSLKYNIDVSILIISKSHLTRYGDVMDYYDNMIKEGKVIYGT